ncbi:MAG TPA: ROK family protein [Candidatus Nanopelagicales bacterium]
MELERTLAIDCGGSGLKGSVLDDEGAMIADRVRVPTPYPMAPDRFVTELVAIAEQLPAADRATVGMPGMIRHGRVISTPHYITVRGPHSKVDPALARAWDHFDAQAALGAALGIPTRVVNDAEVHAAAVVSGEGLEVTFTLGTGLGCAVFDDGVLVPKIELSRAPVRKGVIYDEWIGDRSRRELGAKRWSNRVRKVIDGLRPMFLWDRCYVGGGNAERLTVDLGDDVTIVPNSAGIVGGIRLWELDERPSPPEQGDQPALGARPEGSPPE